MQVKYVGPLGGGVVVIDRETGREYVAEPGGVIDVPEALGRSLLEQATNWQPAKPRAKK